MILDKPIRSDGFTYSIGYEVQSEPDKKKYLKAYNITKKELKDIKRIIQNGEIA